VKVAVATYRPRSTPERLAVVAAALVPAALAYPAVHAATGFAPVCPLREVTGVPCPFCGGTTAATALADGRLSDALAANPFVPALAVVLAGVLLVVAARALGLATPPRSWPRDRQRTGALVVGALVTASWAFQLGRYGWL
jgi:Protein of unknown function (DUF2752)